jgi:mRNA-degrading endonuclease RelE of RelBE toxin-antitoxin system
MTYEVILAPTAVGQYRSLKANVRAVVRDAMDRHLSHQPRRVSRSRIKRLRGLTQPQFRLRVGDIRVFYDVGEKRVEVLAIVTKAQAETWLKEEGTPDEEGGAGES